MGESLTFSVKNRSLFLKQAQADKIDFVTTTCDINEALFALLASKAGKKCAIFISDDFQSELNLVVDQHDATDKSLVAFRKQFPHLILPDEYLHIQKSNPFKKILPNTIRKKDIGKYESLIQFTNNEIVSLEKEYKISSQRLLISIIKNAVKHGAIILNHTKSEIVDENKIEVTDQISQKKTVLEFEHFLSFTKNNISDPEFHYYLNKKHLFLKRSLKFHTDKEQIRFIRFQDYFLLHGKGSELNDDHKKDIVSRINEILGLDEAFSKEDIFVEKKRISSKMNNLKEVLKSCEKICKEKLNWNSSDFQTHLSKINAFDAKFENRIEIQELIEFADFKYDEAKQTGVTPILFKNLFYQFGSEIEEITEKAYELRNEFDSYEKLWFFLQLWFCFENEMIHSESDFQNRLNNNHSKKDKKETEYKEFIKNTLLSFRK